MIKRYRNIIFKYIINFYLLIFFLNINTTFLRMQRFYDISVIFVPIFGILNWILCIICWEKNIFKTKVLKMLLMILIINFFLGIYYKNNILEVIIDFFNCISFLILCESNIFSNLIEKKIIKKISFFIAISTVFSVFIINLIPLKKIVSGLLNVNSLYPLIYLKGIFIYLYTIILLLGIRRSSLICLLVFFLYKFIKQNRKMKLILIFLGIIISINIFVFTLNNEKIILRVKIWEKMYNKSKTTLSFIEDPKSFIYGKNKDPRLEEIKSALEQSHKSTFNILFGNGLGYKYYIAYIGEYRKNIHISPFSFYIKNGIVFTVLFYFYLIHKIFKGRKNSEYVYCILAIVDSFFSYTLFINLLGIISFNKLKIKKLYYKK